MPGAEPKTLADYARAFGHLSPAELALEIPCPVLVETAHGASPLGQNQAFHTEYVEASEVISKLLAPENREVLLVQKRLDAAFSGHISVGRTPNLDVCVARLGVSKFHAYFSEHEGIYHLTDKSSTNGTFVEGLRLTPGEAFPLRDGVIVEFGNQRFTFMLTSRWHRLLQSVRAQQGQTL